MATPIQVTGGGFTYSAPTFTYGQTSQAINGGYTFDLPLATVAAFTNNALAFSAANSQSAKGFFNNVFATGQAGVTGASNKAYEYQDKSLAALQGWQNRAFDVQQYGIKKKYGRGCFITTAVCKQQGLSDNCWQLMRLRKFRDEHMLKSTAGKKLVAEYYENAPRIVEAIDKLPNAAAIYAYLSCHYIDRALQQLSVDNFEGATATYTALFYKAAELANHQFTIKAPKVKQQKPAPKKPTMTVTVKKRNGG